MLFVFFTRDDEIRKLHFFSYLLQAIQNEVLYTRILLHNFVHKSMFFVTVFFIHTNGSSCDSFSPLIQMLYRDLGNGITGNLHGIFKFQILENMLQTAVRVKSRGSKQPRIFIWTTV